MSSENLASAGVVWRTTCISCSQLGFFIKGEDVRPSRWRDKSMAYAHWVALSRPGPKHVKYLAFAKEKRRGIVKISNRNWGWNAKGKQLHQSDSLHKGMCFTRCNQSLSECQNSLSCYCIVMEFRLLLKRMYELSICKMLYGESLLIGNKNNLGYFSQ